MASHEVVTCRGEELGATAGISARLFDPCDWVTIAVRRVRQVAESRS